MSDSAIWTLRRAAISLDSTPETLRPLVDAIGGASYVLIGEASHGTHEFYRARAALTRALIQDHGFNIVAVAADWPDAYRANRWVRQTSKDESAAEALGDFTRFPRWMWRNWEVVEFLTWLRAHNATRDADARIGFYGLDLYSLHRSISAVLDYLHKVDPAAANRAWYRYGCFEDFAEDTQAYGYPATVGLSKSCEDAVVAQLVELRRQAGEYTSGDDGLAADEYFYAEQNARLVLNAEKYYRAMFGGRVDSWNLRDTHMMQTLQALVQHRRQTADTARVVVWAHNAHVGDARATEMMERGEITLGQLVRQHAANDAWLIGFTTHTGTVTAASDWDKPSARRRIAPPTAGSYEHLFHDLHLPHFLLFLREGPAREALMAERLQRAIGVVYRPNGERTSHYFKARLPDQFDAVIHIDETSALEPLDRWANDEVDLPETYPFGV